MKRYGLIGYPLSHSFSQKYFEEKFRSQGIDGCAYELFPIPSIEGLDALLKAKPDLHGLNVTIPYKRSVLPYLDDASSLPKGLDACNCIRIDNGRLYGHNTDVIGFERTFSPLLQPHHTRALILGSGGAAAAVAWCLHKLGIAFSIVSRKPGPGAQLSYADIDASLVAAHPVIINTTPLGMYPNIHEAPPLPYDALTPGHYLFDMHYNPEKTLFLQKGEAKGAAIKNGYEMLVIQAEESWRIWNSW